MHNAMATRRLLLDSVCAACRSSIAIHSRTAPAALRVRRYADDAPSKPMGGLSGLASNMDRSRQAMQQQQQQQQGQQGQQTDAQAVENRVQADLRSLFGTPTSLFGRDDKEPRETEDMKNMRETYYFHVYATKHNTHITICTPKHEPMKKLSLSTGNIGFKKANRGTYDAAYQLVSFMLSRIVEQGDLAKMKRIEVVLRGFGVGREAVTKAILGQEGSAIRKNIVAVTDATRLKFGGTRSPKPRRLG